MSDGFGSQWDSDRNPVDASNPYAAPAEVGVVAGDVDGELASLSARFWGALLDGLLMLPAVAIIVAIVVMMEESFRGNELVEDLVESVVGIVVASVWFLLLNGYSLAKNGQSLGKMAAGTKIVDATTGEILPLMPLFLKRYFSLHLISLIPIIGGFFDLLDPLMIFRENRRCLHDDIAGTKVINVH